ncbi:MAG: diguanylate cyclase, partial [Planctomycetota bacterium]
MHAKFDELRLSGQLPSPSSAGLRILELTKDDDYDHDELVRTILADPALSGRLIKIANNGSQDGLPNVTTVAQATMRLGHRAVRSIALGFTMVADHRRGRSEAFDYDGYWSEALATAVAAHVLGQVTRGVEPSVAFTCALLADVGKLAFASIHPERYSEILQEHPAVTDVQLARLESRVFGIDHFEVSAAIMASWGLPREFQEVALLRSQESVQTDLGVGDDSELSDDKGSMLTVVRVARTIARILIGSWDTEDARWRGTFLSLQVVCREVAMEYDALLSLCDAIVPSWRDWASIIGGQTSQVGSFHDVATELDRRGLRAGVDGIGAPRAQGASGEEQEASLFQPELDLPVQALDRAGATEEREPTRVLLIDDDTQMLRLIGHHLRREGYDVLTSDSSQKGLALAMEHHPQIVITDWMMPGMSGLQLCETLRRSQAGTKMYILLVTSRGEDDQIVEAFEAGADDYVVKPFNPKILLSRVRAAQRMIQLRERVEDSERGRLRQVAELGIMTRKLRAAALTDTLTELPNRRYAMKRLKQEWEAAQRTGRALSVVMCDIDKFKSVNDTYGHDTGDIVLREVAHTLQAHGRASDVLCRLGGEEFIVINVATDVETSEKAAERLRSAVHRHVIRHGAFQRSVTLSLGVAQMTDDMESIDDLIKASDEALYDAKESGRNRVCVAGQAEIRIDD